MYRYKPSCEIGQSILTTWDLTVFGLLTNIGLAINTDSRIKVLHILFGILENVVGESNLSSPAMNSDRYSVGRGLTASL